MYLSTQSHSAIHCARFVWFAKTEHNEYKSRSRRLHQQRLKPHHQKKRQTTQSETLVAATGKSGQHTSTFDVGIHWSPTAKRVQIILLLLTSINIPSTSRFVYCCTSVYISSCSYIIFCYYYNLVLLSLQLLYSTTEPNTTVCISHQPVIITGIVSLLLASPSPL